MVGWSNHPGLIEGTNGDVDFIVIASAHES
jgi:hypothetical protein